MSAENTARTAFLVMGFVMIILSLAIISRQLQKIHYQQPATMSKLDSCQILVNQMQSDIAEIKAMLQPVDTVDGTYGSKVDSSLNSCYSTIH